MKTRLQLAEDKVRRLERQLADARRALTAEIIFAQEAEEIMAETSYRPRRNRLVQTRR